MYCSIALAPAAAVGLFGAGHGVIYLAFAGGLTALRAGVSGRRGAWAGQRLRRVTALRRLPADLPSEYILRQTVERSLWHSAQPSTDAPYLVYSVDGVIRRCYDALHMPTSDAMDLHQLATLYTLRRVLELPASEASRLAQCFRRPDAVLALRDHLHLSAS
ncbi:hypothetical protein [Sagittula sp. SSi028]|uniref:hypothetical protein n=1 Tax=Sagittula sp. SSi028 TaxID=3400636 RepID=UPI003AF96120